MRAAFVSQVGLVGAAFILLFLFEATGLTTPAAQDWQWAVSTNLTHERVVGLLNLPEIMGAGCGSIEPKRVDLYKTPSTLSPPIGSIALSVSDRQADGTCGSARIVVRRAESRSDEQLPTDETGYEIAAAIVYQRSGLWFRIALQHGSAWITRESAQDFQSYPELLLTDKSDYLRKGWDGRLWPAPGAAAATQVPSGWSKHFGENIPIDVLGVRRIRNEVWIHVRLNTESCGERLTGVRSATGWLPAYRPPRRTSVWFYSRGC
jgi:hypothetical protein